MIVDPAARRADGESVRIAKDVLCAGATVRLCLPDGPEEWAKALAKRGERRPVVVGDDRALLRVVSLLHRERDLAGSVLSMVPVGGAVSLARSLGVPTGAVAAARAVLDGAERRMDLLVDDSDGVVLGGLTIPPLRDGRGAARPASPPAHPWLSTCRSLVRGFTARPARAAAPDDAAPTRLRVEADGVTLADLDHPVAGVSVGPAARTGYARVEVHPALTAPGTAPPPSPLHADARTVTVTGADFRYRADAVVTGPVRRRTWAVRAGAWGLALPPRP
ncbi:diacylglycerol kinase catalytic domain-containing protein [Streptomyces beihaiensis]|uniref:Acylglycerol kinase family protein n=1 Tax=Streptomyces beihaiensis TaxID=2984495 RepID=A0ABT3TUR8_9ACTN|nr:diacylglycerol kinase [Streptomyces beihaiensis]MCX3060764.1 acylglycerol kinase family protein [Streptomyces beihaiensis]